VKFRVDSLDETEEVFVVWKFWYLIGKFRFFERLIFFIILNIKAFFLN
jgi:hypothetical protein